MLLKASGSMRRCGDGVFTEIARAMHQEWSGLQFDGTGRVIHPDTGESIETLRLTSGRHGARTGVYRIVLDNTAVSEDGAKTHASVLEVNEVRNTSDRLRLNAADANDRAWRGELDAHDGRALTIKFKGNGDMHSAAEWLDGKRPTGCAGWFVSGRIKIEGSIDLAPLDEHRPGQLANVSGRLGRYPIALMIDHVAHLDRSEFQLSLRISSRRSGRLILLALSWPIGKILRETLTEALNDESLEELAVEIDSVRHEAEVLGGIAPLVHEWLWNPGAVDVGASSD